jgi:hypothetical protein
VGVRASFFSVAFCKVRVATKRSHFSGPIVLSFPSSSAPGDAPGATHAHAVRQTLCITRLPYAQFEKKKT